MLRFRVVFASSLFLVQGCVLLLETAECNELGNPVVTDFYYKPWVGQEAGVSAYNIEEHFSTYDLEDQYRIYLYGHACIHPPELYLALLIALRGESSVEFLKNRLNQSDKDWKTAGVIMIFYWMQVKNTYNVAGDAALMMLMEQAVGGMASEDWRELAQRKLEKIVPYSEIEN